MAHARLTGLRLIAAFRHRSVFQDFATRARPAFGTPRHKWHKRPPKVRASIRLGGSSSTSPSVAIEATLRKPPCTDFVDYRSYGDLEISARTEFTLD